MGWSESAPSLPSGASWSGYLTSNANTSNNYNKFRVSARIARGTNDTIYVHVIIQCAGKTYGTTGSTSLRAEVAIGSGGYDASGTYSCSAAYDDWTNCKNLYYTGTADAGTTIYARVYWTSSNTAGPVSLTAPAYVTSYAVTYNGNGADGGSTASQSKVYNTDLTLRENGFTREGYTFLEWNTDPDGAGTGYAEGDAYTLNAALTLYAIWKRNNIPVYANVDGTIRQIEKAYVNAGGVIRECAVYVNADGTIREIG